MAEHTLTRTGDVPLVFEGEQIAEASSRRRDGPGQNRWHTLRLYRTKGRRYVLAVCYRSQWQGEDNLDTAVMASTVEAVRDELRGYPVPPPGVGYPPGEAYADKQRRMETDLRRRFDTAVTELFGGLADEFAERID